MRLGRARRNTVRPAIVGVDANRQNIPRRRRLRIPHLKRPRITRRGVATGLLYGAAVVGTGTMVHHGMRAADTWSQRHSLQAKTSFDSGQMWQIRFVYPWMKTEHLGVLKKISEVSGHPLSETAIMLNQLIDAPRFIEFPRNVEGRLQMAKDVRMAIDKLKNDTKYALAVDMLGASMREQKGATKTLEHWIQAEQAKQKSAAVIDSLKARDARRAKTKIKTYPGTR